MKEEPVKNAEKIIGISYAICMIVRCFEYFIIRTDETIIAENVFHKVFGIILVIGLIVTLKLSTEAIGVKWRQSGQILWGFLIGILVYAISYGIEFVIYTAKAEQPFLTVFVEAFSLNGDAIPTKSLGFIGLCMLMNIINVVMEEGLFRGVYDRLLQGRYTFWKKAMIIATLFGFWHITMTLRSFYDGEMTLAQMLFMNFGYIWLAGMMSLKWSILKEMTGAIWIGMGEHFFSNTITNLLHIETVSGADPLQIVRVMGANIISFAIIAVIYIRWHERKVGKEIENSRVIQ